MESGHHVVSLSLGAVAEPSALVVVAPHSNFWHPGGRADDLSWDNRFDVIWLERFKTGRPVPGIVARVSELVSERRLAKGYSILLDITSTGAAALRAFEAHGLFASAIEITNAGSEEYTNGVQRVPLRDAIGAAQIILQTKRLQVASALDLATTLVADLQAFDPKLVTRDLDLRGGKNADLVLALAVALWWGDRLRWDDEIAEGLLSSDSDWIYERNPTNGY